jgi:hypothetical protein
VACAGVGSDSSAYFVSCFSPQFEFQSMFIHFIPLHISSFGTKQLGETLFAERCAECVSGAAKGVVVRVCVSQRSMGGSDSASQAVRHDGVGCDIEASEAACDG